METIHSTETVGLAQPEKVPEFPRLTGPLGRFVDAMTNDIPYDYKALAALTYVGVVLSGNTELASPYDHLQPRFYACLIGPKGSAKSFAQRAVNEQLQELGDVNVVESVNSEPALVNILEKKPRTLYFADELTDAFAKAKAQRIFDGFKKLYEHNKISNIVKNGETTATGCHFAISGCCTREDFATVWQGTSGAALQSRFVLAFSEDHMPHVRTAHDPALAFAVEDLKYAVSTAPQQIELPETKGVFTSGLIGDGSQINPDYSRVVDMGRRFALIMAACNGKTQIDDETMLLARAFIEYQIEAYETQLPPDAWSYVQGFENRIIKFYKRQSEPKSYRDCQNNLTPHNSPGGFGPFRQAFNNLTSTNPSTLMEAGTNSKGFKLYRLDPTANLSS